jgi:hypothetical protein
MDHKIEFTDKEITRDRPSFTESISPAIKRREWITGLWMNTNNMNSPAYFVFR